MKRFKLIPLLILATALVSVAPIVVSTGCKSPSRAVFNTLGATHLAVKSSFDGYLDSIISGQTTTNNLPTVAASYNTFQQAFKVAVDAASGNTNAPIGSDLATLATSTIATIQTSKGK